MQAVDGTGVTVRTMPVRLASRTAGSSVTTVALAPEVLLRDWPDSDGRDIELFPGFRGWILVRGSAQAARQSLRAVASTVAKENRVRRVCLAAGTVALVVLAALSLISAVSLPVWAPLITAGLLASYCAATTEKALLIEGVLVFDDDFLADGVFDVRGNLPGPGHTPNPYQIKSLWREQITARERDHLFRILDDEGVATLLGVLAARARGIAADFQQRQHADQQVAAARAKASAGGHSSL